jgi:hypothetical protein
MNPDNTKPVTGGLEVVDLLIDPIGFNLKPIPGRSHEIFDPQFTEEKRRLAILLEVDTNVIYLLQNKTQKK